MRVACMLNSESVSYMNHNFSYLTGMLHVGYMQITCPVQHILARREHSKYIT